MTLRSAALLLLLSASYAWGAPGATPPENFTVDVPTKVPGATLQPGSYSIHLVNHLTDRDIVEVDSEDGRVHTTFIGLENGKISKPAAPQVVKWSNPADGITYLRGWYSLNSSRVTEFVYPKEDAVGIAKANQATVPAIDPASEGRVADPALSRDDMRLITLWLLSPTPVAAGGIKAERYEQASNAPPQRPPVRQLPHTASSLAWVEIAGFALLLMGAALRFRRLRVRSGLSLRKVE